VERYRIDADDRRLFKRCRRQWDFAAGVRRGLHPLSPPTPSADAVLAGAMRKALDVYYYPGMWEWPRDVVVRLVHIALGEALTPGPILDLAHRLVDAYAAWAPEHDRMTPVRVAIGFEVNVADPVITGRDLTTPAGDEVRYRAWADALAVDGDNRPWLMFHRLGGPSFLDPEVAALDEEMLTGCWAWEVLTLDPRLAGALLTELCWSGGAPGRFRRTALAYSRTEIEGAGRQLGAEAMVMLEAGLVAYPSPSVEHCSECPFRAPCRAVRAGENPGALFAAGYERRS
jgi:hypothetical protein